MVKPHKFLGFVGPDMLTKDSIKEAPDDTEMNPLGDREISALLKSMSKLMGLVEGKGRAVSRLKDEQENLQKQMRKIIDDGERGVLGKAWNKHMMSGMVQGRTNGSIRSVAQVTEYTLDCCSAAMGLIEDSIKAHEKEQKDD